MTEFRDAGGATWVDCPTSIRIDYESRLLDVIESSDGEIYVLLKEPVSNWLDQLLPQEWQWRWQWHRDAELGPGHGVLTVPAGMEVWFWLRWT